jgi:hypothetical protein
MKLFIRHIIIITILLLLALPSFSQEKERKKEPKPHHFGFTLGLAYHQMYFYGTSFITPASKLYKTQGFAEGDASGSGVDYIVFYRRFLPMFYLLDYKYNFYFFSYGAEINSHGYLLKSGVRLRRVFTSKKRHENVEFEFPVVKFGKANIFSSYTDKPEIYHTVIKGKDQVVSIGAELKLKKLYVNAGFYETLIKNDNPNRNLGITNFRYFALGVGVCF